MAEDDAFPEDVAKEPCADRDLNWEPGFVERHSHSAHQDLYLPGPRRQYTR